jgi:hypothetical protein
MAPQQGPRESGVAVVVGLQPTSAHHTAAVTSCNGKLLIALQTRKVKYIVSYGSMSLLQSYKSFVRAHPGLVLNAERLLHWVVWNPERFSGSEYAYEGFNAAVGLLGIYNESILTEHPDYNATVAKYALWLAAVEQVGVNRRF